MKISLPIYRMILTPTAVHHNSNQRNEPNKQNKILNQQKYSTQTKRNLKIDPNSDQTKQNTKTHLPLKCELSALSIYYGF